MNTMSTDNTTKAFMDRYGGTMIMESIWSSFTLLNAKSSDNKTAYLSDKKKPRQTKIQWTGASLNRAKEADNSACNHHFCCFSKWDRNFVEFLVLWWWQLLVNTYCFLLFFFLTFFALFFTFLPNLLLKIYCMWRSLNKTCVQNPKSWGMWTLKKSFSFSTLGTLGSWEPFFSQGNPSFFCFYNILSQKLVGI
jgi:hypothetical protein